MAAEGKNDLINSIDYTNPMPNLDLDCYVSCNT